MARASLRFASDLLKRLGEELNPSPVNGIIELVKNSYDADSPRCDVTLVQPRVVDGRIVPGHLIIEDWGDGMTEKDFREGWLVLGRSRKSSRVTTRLGRRPVGDKGLGRLSALRMGSLVTVVSRPRSSRQKELHLSLDWSRFDRSHTPTQVALNLRTVAAPKRSHPGTTIRIDGIQRKLEHAELERLNRGLLLVANPFEMAKEPFAVNLIIDPAPRGLLPKLPDLFKSASFVLEAKILDDRSMSASLYDGVGQLLAEATPEDLEQRFSMHGASAEARVASSLKLWIFLLRSSEFPEGTKQLAAVRNLLQHFGGMHVFLDGVRVAPYGDPNDDWVGMASMRASSPEFMPQPRTALGYLTLENQPELRQKTDRSGFLESPTTDALRAFARAVLSWQQSVRIGFRDNVEDDVRNSAKKDREAIASELQNLFTGLHEAPKKRATQLVKRLSEVSSRHEAVLNREVELYRALGTAGIASSVFAHEAANNSLGRIRSDTTAVQFRVKKKDLALASQTAPLIERITNDVDSLLAVSQITLSLIKARNRKRQKVYLAPVVEGVLDLFAPYFALSKVNIDYEPMAHEWSILGSRAAIECVVVNLVTNAMQAMEMAGTDAPIIRIGNEISGDRVLITVTDNGPGIQGISLTEIWQPGETTREQGTGLGLTIVKASIRDLGGSIAAEATSDIGGARFTIKLPLLIKD